MSTGIIKELEEISSNEHRPLERRLIDTAVWFSKNKDRIPKHDLEKKVEFLTQTMNILLELFALNIERLRQVDGHTSERLWLPKGLNASGDMKRFG